MTTQPLNPVANRLKEKGIKRVLIVDDAFDQPARSDFTQNEMADFWNALEDASPEQGAAFTKLIGSVPNSEQEIDDAGVVSLYEHRDELGPLQTAFDAQLRGPLEEKHAHLDPLIKSLETELDLEVDTAGTMPTENPKEVDLIFMDYYLGTPADQASVIRSRDEVRRLLMAYPVGTEKPLVVLMSSNQNVKGLAEEFRAETGIVGGMFYFMPESDLTNQLKLSLNMDILVMALPSGHRIQKFIDTVESNAESITKDFIAGIKRLNLDDYVYIQRLSLQADGQPLGDYLLWLYSAFYGHLLFDSALGSERRELDKMTFTDWVPSHSIPSKQLTTMYYAALFDTTVDPLGPHPRWTIEEIGKENEDSPKENPPQEVASPTSAVADLILEKPTASSNAQFTIDPIAREKKADASPRYDMTEHSGSSDIESEALAAWRASPIPYFNMGDVFLNAKSLGVLMVCNPACDLEFTPDGKRLPDRLDSIVMIPGALEKLQDADANTSPLTHVFEHEEESYLIQWRPKRLITISYQNVEKWLSDNEFIRVARLRMPFSLAIQHLFASELTRVGVPAPPPFYRPLKIAVYTKGFDGSHEQVGANDSAAEAFLVSSPREKNRYVLPAGMIRFLHDSIDKLVGGGLLPEEKSLTEAEDKMRRQANISIKKALKSREDFNAWREVSEPFGLSGQNKRKKFDKLGILVEDFSGRDGTWAADQAWSVDSILKIFVSELGTKSPSEDDTGTSAIPDSG